MGKFCQNCGLAVNEGDRFCHKCGTKLYESADAPAGQGEAEERRGTIQAPIQAPPPIIQVQTPSQEPVYYVQMDYVQEEPYVPDRGLRQMFFRWDNRLNRKRYFLRLMLLQTLFIPISLLLMLLPKDVAPLVSMALVLVWMVPVGMLCLRRCHDLGHSGWFLVKTIIPILGMMWLIKYFLSSRDDDTPALSSTFFIVAIGLPFVGILVWMYLMCAEGMRGENEYGPDPLGQQAEAEPQENKVLEFISKMEAPGEMRGILAVFAAMVLIIVLPSMIGSLFTESRSSAVARTQETQQVEQVKPAEDIKQSTDKPVPPAPVPPPEVPKPVMPEPQYPPGAQEKYEQARGREAAVAETTKKETGKSVGQKLTPVQLEAADALYQFHANITKKDLRKAYDCMSPNMKNRVSYEGWAPGFKTTVSSEVYDVKVASESKKRMVLTYFLKSVDNPGGEKNFTGTAVVVKTNKGWKLEEITNKLK